MTLIRRILSWFRHKPCPVLWANPKKWNLHQQRLMSAHFDNTGRWGAMS